MGDEWLKSYDIKPMATRSVFRFLEFWPRCSFKPDNGQVICKLVGWWDLCDQLSMTLISPFVKFNVHLRMLYFDLCCGKVVAWSLLFTAAANSEIPRDLAKNFSVLTLILVRTSLMGLFYSKNTKVFRSDIVILYGETDSYTSRQPLMILWVNYRQANLRKHA